MTVAALLGYLYPRLHATGSSDLVWWAKADLIVWVNEAVTNLAVKANILVSRNTSSSTSMGTRTYAMPAGTVKPLHVSVAARPLKPSTLAELDARDAAASIAVCGAGEIPSHWYSDRMTLWQAGLYPSPRDTQPIWMIYAGEPSADLVEGDSIPLPDVLAGFIGDSVLARAYGRRGEAQMPDLAAHLAKKLSLYQQAAEHYWGS